MRLNKVRLVLCQDGLEACSRVYKLCYSGLVLVAREDTKSVSAQPSKRS